MNQDDLIRRIYEENTQSEWRSSMEHWAGELGLSVGLGVSKRVQGKRWEGLKRHTVVQWKKKMEVKLRNDSHASWRSVYIHREDLNVKNTGERGSWGGVLLGKARVCGMDNQVKRWEMGLDRHQCKMCGKEWADSQHCWGSCEALRASWDKLMADIRDKSWLCFVKISGVHKTEAIAVLLGLKCGYASVGAIAKTKVFLKDWTKVGNMKTVWCETGQRTIPYEGKILGELRGIDCKAKRDPSFHSVNESNRWVTEKSGKVGVPMRGKEFFKDQDDIVDGICPKTIYSLVYRVMGALGWSKMTIS